MTREGTTMDKAAIGVKFMDYACMAVGRPYIWGGNGDLVWVSPERGLQPISAELGPNEQFDPPRYPLGFDCVGLVKWALKMAGGPDLRATHNAQTIFSQTGTPTGDERPWDWWLAFYGKDRENITHIAVVLNLLMVLEAAGGGSTTKTWEEARRINAKVRVGRGLRNDRVGERRLSQLMDLK